AVQTRVRGAGCGPFPRATLGNVKPSAPNVRSVMEGMDCDAVRRPRGGCEFDGGDSLEWIGHLVIADEDNFVRAELHGVRRAARKVGSECGGTRHAQKEQEYEGALNYY